VPEHPGDLLSALLDGELTVDEATEVRAHVDGCPVCRAELEDVRIARRFLRELPAVEPPAWALAEMLAGDKVVSLGRRRAALVNIAASVAAGVLLLVASASSIAPPALQPEVAGAVTRHASTVSALLGSTGARIVPATAVVPTTAPQRDVEHLPAPYDAPDTLAGYQLVDAYRSPGGVHLLYQRGGFGLSVFELPGSVDWDGLPGDGTRMVLHDHRAWRWDGSPANGRLVVLEDDGMVVIVVGDESADAVRAVASSLPRARDLPMPQRMTRAVAKALELLSPAG
jgi:anti-sigma factor RsiW